MTVDQIANVILGFLHTKWEAECLDKDANISQSSGLNLPTAFASMELAQEDCTPDVLRALWAVESEYQGFFFWHIDASRSDGTWYRALYDVLEERVSEEAIHYLPGGLRYEELHAARLRKARRPLRVSIAEMNDK